MDYLAEIAENPDIEEALDRLPALEVPVQIREQRAALSATYPGVWRSVLINALHVAPDLASKVWRALGACKSARENLARVAGPRYFPYPWSKPSLGACGFTGSPTQTALEKWIQKDATGGPLEEGAAGLNVP